MISSNKPSPSPGPSPSPSPTRGDLLNVTHDPPDDSWATLMNDVSRGVKEKRNLSFVRFHETMTYEIRKAQSRVESLRSRLAATKS